MERIGESRLLLAHSDPEKLKRLRDVVEQAGYYICATATDGGEVIRQVRTQRPVLVVMDLALAYVDGLEVLRYLGRKEPQVKTLVLSSSGGNVLTRAIAAGACGVLCVPFADSLLLEEVKRLAWPEELELTEEMVDKQVVAIFANLRAPMNLKGYHYMREAINIAVNARGVASCHGMTEKIYAPIAQEYDATVSQVERAMRSFTQHVFAQAGRDMLERYFPGEDLEQGSLSNSKFITGIAGYICRQHRREQLRLRQWG